MTRRFDWTPFTRRRRDVLATLVVAPTATILVPLSLSSLLPWERVGPVVFACAGSLYLRAGARYNALVCPRCGGRFFESMMRGDAFETSVGLEILSKRAACRHCGLRIGEHPDAPVA